MYVERFLADLCYGLKDRESKRDIRNERAVHHVQMKPVGLTAVDHLDVAVEM
jgi:hypothetical protein